MNQLCIFLKSRVYPMPASVGIAKNTSDLLYTHIGYTINTHIGYTIIVGELRTWDII